MTAIVVLGMHRSGTSCLAGMLSAAGLASAGDTIRNWDNARGHHEMLEAVRLNEAVLAHSGGHWLSPPATLRWTDEHAAARDALLAAQIDGRPSLLKDPRTLLTLAFWRASAVPWRAIGIVRHPLAVARSLESWREMPLAEGVALWAAHARALEADRAEHAYPLIDFDRPKAEVVAAVVAAFGPDLDEVALAAAYEEQLVHHDDGEAPEVAGLADALELHQRLVGTRASFVRTRYPHAALAAFTRALSASDLAAALAEARAALASFPDTAAVLVPIITALVRRRALAEARALVEAHAARLDAGLADLLLGKIALAGGDAARAVHHLEAACAVSQPYFQARHLLPQALRTAGRADDARTALQAIVSSALYPHGPLATLAEWSWLDGEHARSISEMHAAVAAAPPHRRGRLRTRLAEWLIARGEPNAARAQLLLAIDEDPGYGRSRQVLAALPAIQ
jgi:tetratricopeptide (TPR) repeat protein